MNRTFGSENIQKAFDESTTLGGQKRSISEELTHLFGTVSRLHQVVVQLHCGFYGVDAKENPMPISGPGFCNFVVTESREAREKLAECIALIERIKQDLSQ